MALDCALVDARQGEKGAVVVLLHGFKGFPEDLAPFARSMGVPALFLFPAAPIDLAPTRGRAWWPEDDAPSPHAPPRTVDAPAAGLDVARACIDAFLADVRRQHPDAPLVVGGFSQGAMLTFDWALRSDFPPAGLVQRAGAPMCLDEWRPRIASRRGQRVFFAHGRGDAELSFAALEAFKDELAAAGWRVTWCPFDGGHEVPLVALRALKKFLRELP